MNIVALDNTISNQCNLSINEIKW